MNTRETNVVEGDQFYTKKNNKNITNDLNKYSEFSDDIKYRANYIYIRMNHSTRRKKKRQLLLFFCVYSAYKELGIKVNPADLGDIFGLTSGQLQKTDAMFSHLQTGYKPVCQSISVNDYIHDYGVKIGLEEHIENIIQLCDNIIIKDTSLSQASSQPVAAGMIKYYMMINGIELADKNALIDAARRSDTTIESMYKKICLIDNA